MGLHLVAIGICIATMPNYQLKDREVVECKLYVSSCVSVNYSRYMNDVELVRHCAKLAREKYDTGIEWCLNNK